VHHHTIQINHQQDTTVSQVYYLTFMCGSTCFGRLPAHHQEHTTALGASGFTVGEKRLKRFGLVGYDMFISGLQKEYTF